tara:strand:- start:2237 stop:2593 length:357 start_codon:yes stop_codon:yes gene_type:complete
VCEEKSILSSSAWRSARLRRMPRGVSNDEPFADVCRGIATLSLSRIEFGVFNLISFASFALLRKSSLYVTISGCDSLIWSINIFKAVFEIKQFPICLFVLGERLLFSNHLSIAHFSYV